MTTANCDHPPQTMNVKFRMPKFQKMKSKGGIVKEMTMTIIATSISIVLTFGTGMWLDHRQKEKDGRQIAMMVISDIDENIEVFNEYAKWEEKHLEMAKYVEAHLDQIGQVPEDTLAEVLNYVMEDDIYMIDDSKERIFNSSQETWKNIDNPLFINIVQSFYQERRIYDDKFESEIAYRQPLSTEEAYRLLASYNKWSREEIAVTLKELIPTRKAQLFFDFSPSRCQQLYSIAKEWQQKSDQLKFIMGITDEELQDYLNNQQRTGEPVTDRQLVGTWRATEAFGNQEETIEFKRDHRFIHCHKQYASSTRYTGKLIIANTMEGTWYIKGDSLYRDYESDTYKLDRSDVKYAEEDKELVEDYIARYNEKLTKRNEESKKNGSRMGHRSNSAFIDRSGSKIELGRTEIDDEGLEETYKTYMVKKMR